MKINNTLLQLGDGRILPSPFQKKKKKKGKGKGKKKEKAIKIKKSLLIHKNL